MNTSRRFPSRLVLTLVACVAVVVVGAASAAGESGLPGGAASSDGVASRSVASSAVDTPIAAPAWCYGTGSVPGITVVGQATIKDRGTQARDAAIAEAVADATDQATTAADAAGIQLGAVLDLEVSAMPMVYPVMEGVAYPEVGKGTVSSPGWTGAGSSGSTGSTGPDAPPDQYLGSVMVTMTWAIA
jgi:hypothetical protein